MAKPLENGLGDKVQQPGGDCPDDPAEDQLGRGDVPERLIEERGRGWCDDAEGKVSFTTQTLWNNPLVSWRVQA